MKEFEVGETLVEFDKLLIANFQEIRSVISSRAAAFIGGSPI